MAKKTEAEIEQLHDALRRIMDEFTPPDWIDVDVREQSSVAQQIMRSPHLPQTTHIR